MIRDELKLYAITDRSWLMDNETLVQKVEQAILGGTTMIQLREKKLSGDALKKLALEVKSVCNKYRVPFIINDDVMLAKEIDADGVHVGITDMDVSKARQILGTKKIVGATAKTIEQALNAMNEGADYLGSGAIFGSTTKTDARPMSMELLNSICEAVDIPVVAIGGIDDSNVVKLKNTKIAGIAVVSGIFARKDVKRAAINLNDLLYGKKVIHCITNHVTVNEVANVIHAVGGSPIMAHHVEEVEEVSKNAAGLLLNLGATDDYASMEIAYKTALKYGHPIVIDPVGVGAITFRRSFLNKLLSFGAPTCIRGNYGEIKAIYENLNTMNGLDDESDILDNHVYNLAKKLGCIIAATGEIDIISDGEEIARVSSGTAMQKKVTGSGCMLSAVICSILAISGKSSCGIVKEACQYMGDTAKMAAEETSGTMSFLNRWIDNISIG